MFEVLDFIGTTIFALGAVLSVRDKELDIVGVIIIALVASIGGGTIRDMLLNVDIFWIAEPLYIYIISATCIVSYFLHTFDNKLVSIMQIADALAMAAFSIIGTSKALSLGVSITPAVLMGVLTAMAGGIIRDLMFTNRPFILSREIFVSASIFGSLVMIILGKFIDQQYAMIIGMVVCFSLRYMGISKKLRFPLFFKV